MYARGRLADLGEGQHLRDLVAGASNLGAAQELVDCEISQGTVTSTGWIVQRSSLPFRETEDLDPDMLTPSGRMLVTRDTGADGRRMLRHWDIVDVEGDILALSRTTKLRAAR
jgi:hypothetical protein